MKAVSVSGDAICGRQPLVVGRPEPTVDVHRLHVINIFASLSKKLLH